MSDATIVSVFPFSFTESKPGLNPREFTIAGAVQGDFTILNIADGRFPVYLDADRGSIWVTVPAAELAKSIVDDYCYTHLASNTEAHPGVFYLEGKLTKADVLGKYSDKLASIKNKQNLWMAALIKLADDDWGKYHRHDVITDIQRYAAKISGLTREWSMDFKPENLKPCVACTTLVSSAAIICPNCRVILDAKKFAELKLTTAG